MALGDHTLTAHYNCADATEEISGNSLTINNGTPISLDGRSALDFGAASGAGSLVSTSDITLGSDFTLSMWFKGMRDPNTNSYSHSTVFNHYNGGSGNQAWDYPMIVLGSGHSSNPTQGKIRFFYNSGTGLQDLTVPDPDGILDYTIYQDDWHMVTATYSSGVMTYYIDGVSVGSITSGQTFTAINTFNGLTAYSNTFARYIDDIRVYGSSALTAADVLELYSSTTISAPVVGSLSTGINTFTEGSDPAEIGTAIPTGDTGIIKDSSELGFFVRSTDAYTVWFKSGGTWSVHQAMTSENLVQNQSYQWGSNTAAYIQTSVPSHTVYVFPRTGAILIDSTPANDENKVDAIVLDSDTSLRIFGSSESTTTTTTSHTISTGSPVTVSDGCDADIVVTEVNSDYTDSLSSKLTAYYKFENNTDDSGVGAGSSLASASAGCAYVAGKSGMGQALHQTSNTAHVALNNPDLVNLGVDHTIAAWIYVPSAQTVSGNPNPFGDIWVFSNVDSTVDWGPLKGVHLGVNHPGYGSGWGMSTNSVKMMSGVGQGQGIYDFAWYVKGTPQDSFPFDEWVHIAYTIHSSDQAAWGSNIKLFINGQLQSTVERTSQPNQNAMLWTEDPDVVLLGGAWEKNRPGMVPYYSGELMYDEIAIWERELSESEIADLYNSGNGVALDTTYATTETVRNDFTVEKNVVVTAPAGTDATNIKVKITK